MKRGGGKRRDRIEAPAGSPAGTGADGNAARPGESGRAPDSAGSRSGSPGLASALLLGVVALFCLTPNWGRMLPEALRETVKVWREGTKLNAAERRALFYDETYPVLLYLRENTPPDAVVLLPPAAFIKDRVMSRRPAGEDLTPLLGMPSSAYSFIYPRVAVHYGSDAPLLDQVAFFLVWDHWGLDRIDPTIARTEENRVRLFEVPRATGAGRGDASRRAGVPRWHGRAVEDTKGPDRWFTPGLLLGLLVLAGIGDGLVRLLDRGRLLPLPGGRIGGLGEGVALRGVLAIAAVPWIVILFDLAGVPIRAWSLLAAAALIASAGFVAGGVGRGGRGSRADATEYALATNRSGLSPARRAPAALVLAIAVAAVVACTLVQIAILPERNYDALVGYDLVGKVMSYEGQYVSSVFTRILYNAQCVYAPFTAANIGFGYVFHPQVQRLWVTLLFAGFLVLFHRRMTHWSGSLTAASLALVLLILPRVMLTQATVAMTDLPSMVFTALALFSVVDLLRGEGRLPAPTLMILAAATARTENLLFGGALAVTVIVRDVRRRRPGTPWWRVMHGAWLVAAPAAFFIVWNFFVVRHLMGYDPAAHFRPPGIDVARMVEVLSRAFRVIAMPQAFGAFSALIPVALGLWIVSRTHGTRHSVPSGALLSVGGTGPAGDVAAGPVTGTLLLLLALMFLAYMPFFYLWDPVLNPLWSMEHTFKRGFLRFMPGIVAAVMAGPGMARLLRRCETGPIVDH